MFATRKEFKLLEEVVGMLLQNEDLVFDVLEQRQEEIKKLTERVETLEKLINNNELDQQ